MTTQDWVIIAAGWIALAMVLTGVAWDNHSHGRRLDRHRAELTNHARRLTLHEHRAAATSVGQPMPTVTKVTATISGDGSLQAHSTYNGRRCVQDLDQTLRLARPPALSDIEHALTEAGRALTATELATRLGRQPWDLLPDIDRDMAAGRIRTVPGHTAGRTAYTLADPTERMPNGMSVLPGVVR